VIADVPDAKDDFFMFPGGVAPTTGMYMASDANYNYTMKGGWNYWRRAAIAMWLLLAAMTLAAGAQYDMPYIQRDGSGDNQERVVTLTPSTFLSVSANGTLQVQSSANFKTALGLATVATSGNSSDLLYSIEYFYTITNAGDSLANGDYYIDQSTGFERIMLNDNGYFLRSFNFLPVWKITDDQGTELYQTTSTGSNPATLTWEVVNGQSPVPSLEQWESKTTVANAIAARAVLDGDNTFTGNNTFTQSLTLNNSTLTLTANATLSGNNTGDQTIISFTPAPATSTSNGTQGTLIQDGNWLYICVATNTWRRIELLNW
jgi:hypothetical protein